MCPKKLSEADKKEILTLYRESEETTSTLAVRYDVSSSTISRFLKAHLSDSEYEMLIQQKRLARTPAGRSKSVMETVKNLVAGDSREDGSEKSETQVAESQEVSPVIPTPSEAERKPILKSIPEKPSEQLELFDRDEDEEDEEDDLNLNVFSLQEFLGEDIGDEDEDFDEDEDDEIDEDELEEDFTQVFPLSLGQDVEILPVTEASFPKICYLVIDRGAELVTRPLKEFRELGKIPVSEIQQKTLPIFDNHRIARRFSNRREKVIKVPDGRLLEKTCSYLQAKGITRIFMDGQVYSL